MRVKDGYNPKVKFSITLEKALFVLVDSHCREVGCHRTAFIERAIRKAVDEEGISTSALVELSGGARELKPRRSPSSSTSIKPRPHKLRRSARGS